MEQEIADLDIGGVPNIKYKVGDHVVYPHHGAGKVLKKEMKEILGEKREYLTIKILHNDMTVMVPWENAGRAGLRRVIGEEAVKKVLAVLRDDVSQMPKNWNRRFKHNREKIKTGDVFELAEVVRNLAIRESEKGLSTGEKQMYTRAKKILASELMYALEMEEDEAETHLDELIEDAHAAPERRGRHRVAGERLERRRDRRRRRQRRTPWGRRAQGVRRSGGPHAARLVARGAARRSATGSSGGAARLRGRRRTAWPAVPSRSESVRNAAGGRAGGDVAVVHDAARPLVTPELVAALRRGARARRRRRDRRRAGDRHRQGGRRGRARGAHARPRRRCGRSRRPRCSARTRCGERSTWTTDDARRRHRRRLAGRGGRRDVRGGRGAAGEHQGHDRPPT